MNRKKMIVAGVGIVAVLALGAFVLLQGRSRQAGAPGTMPGGMRQEASTVVRASQPTTGDLRLTSGLTGTVEADDVVYVYARASGDVTAVHVRAGDMVIQGQVLCEIDTNQVEAARNTMEAAQVRLNEARSNLSRMQLLYDGGALSSQEYEQYSNSLRTAQLQYDAARLTYDQQVGYSMVTAPISGRIESCDVAVYDQVSPSGQLCVIAGEGQSRITFYVTQRMLENMQVGDGLEILMGGISYLGTISEISSMVDRQMGLFRVKAETDDTDQIAIGSTVQLNVVTARTENAMLVPVGAVYYSGGDGYVYLYEDGTARMVPVEVGLYDSEYAQILSGLSGNEQVVSTWSSNLYEGAGIRLWEEMQSEAAEADSITGQ